MMRLRLKFILPEFVTRDRVDADDITRGIVGIGAQDESLVIPNDGRRTTGTARQFCFEVEVCLSEIQRDRIGTADACAVRASSLFTGRHQRREGD
jgi:hypothetical protein